MIKCDVGKWQDEEVKTLFKFVEVKKSEGLSLIKIFEQFAKCVGRHQNSVRNYYYNEIKNLKHDKQRAKALKINTNNHTAKRVKRFETFEAENITRTINEYVENGYSVRRACFELAGGDVGLMIRYQNKYRSKIKNEKEKHMGNVIKMPSTNFMSDEDVSALFMGLVKLVKRQESQRAKMEVQIELESATERLKKALKEIVMKKAQIEKLQSEISLLKQKSEQNKEKEVINRIKSVQNKAKDLIGTFIASKDSAPVEKQG